VLEAGSGLGLLVYPPLEKTEAYWVSYEGEGLFRFVYYVNTSGTKFERVFMVAITLPAGGAGMIREDVTFLTPVPTTTRENALLMMRTFIVPEDLGTPAGAVTLRGAWNFQTPAGWDSVFTPIFNLIERPVIPMMVIRVESDWYAHESEFRYVLQPGQALSVSSTMPIGQVMFVPREQVTTRDCSPEELEAINQSIAQFARDKAAQTQTTPFGLQVSPHYLRKSREQSEVAPVVTANPAPGQPEMVVAPSATGQKIGRNDPCPCGSGKKYKKCHGESA